MNASSPPVGPALNVPSAATGSTDSELINFVVIYCVTIIIAIIVWHFELKIKPLQYNNFIIVMGQQYIIIQTKRAH